jgi:hypothetical protein
VPCGSPGSIGAVAGAMAALQGRVNALYKANTEGTELEQLMLREAVREHSPLTTANPGGSATFLVVFDSRQEAIFKPFIGQNIAQCRHYGQEPVEAVTHEVVAWRLAATMGAPWDQLVPTAVLRNIPPMGGGALINRRRGAPDPQVFDHAEAQADAAAFWDALIAQQDRHANNYRYEHETRRLALIDHAFSFGTPGVFCNGGLFSSRRRNEGRASLTHDEATALQVLLHSTGLHGLHHYILDRRADALRKRAEKMTQTRVLPYPGDF